MFESARLNFTLITYEDFGRVYETLNNQDTCEQLSFMRWPITDEQVRYWCDKAEAGAKDKSELLFIAQNNKTPIGCIGLHLEQHAPAKARVGYWVSADHQRQGYANEMLARIITYAQNDLNIHLFSATTATDNAASASLLTKHGFIESGERIVESLQNAPRPSRLFTR